MSETETEKSDENENPWHRADMSVRVLKSAVPQREDRLAWDGWIFPPFPPPVES
jgi:hypothetical protein